MGLSVDSVPKKAWATNPELKKSRSPGFLVSRRPSPRLGLIDKTRRVSERANVILDEKRNAVFVKVYPLQVGIHEWDYLKIANQMISEAAGRAAGSCAYMASAR